MTNSILIWKTRIGTLKFLAVFMLMVSGLFMLTNLTNLLVALQNPGDPRPTTIGALVKGVVGSNKYITIRGTVKYDQDIVLKETPPAIYFFLREESSSYLFLVRWNGESKPNEGESLTVEGITSRGAPDLQKLVSSRMPILQSAGLETTAGYFLNAGEKPPDVTRAGLGTLLLAGLCFLSGVGISFPSIIFQPTSLEGKDKPGPEEHRTRVTGKLRRLVNSLPPYEYEGNKQKLFENTDASFERLNDKFIVKFHKYARRTLFGFITMKVVETDWGVVIRPSDISKIEMGILFAWRATPALRLSYRDPNNNPQLLIFGFTNTATLQACLQAIRGHKVITGAL